MTIQQLQQYPLGKRGLKVIDKDGTIHYLNGISAPDTLELCIIKGGQELARLTGVEENICKPLLYPLTALTKEIEVYGEKFVPAIEIAKRVDNGHNGLSIVKQYTGMIVVKTDKVDDVENVSIRYANGEIISVCRSETPVLLSTCNTIIQLLQSWFINYQGIEAVNPFDLEVNPYK